MKRELSLHESYQLLKTALVLLLHQWIRDELWVTGGGYHRYPFALSTRAGICQGHDDPLALPRIGVSQRNASRPSLLAWRISRGGRS